MHKTTGDVAQAAHATPNERLLLAQLHQVQRALETQYAARHQQEADVAACATRLETLEQQLAEAQAQLTAVLTSRSWRLTKPLRRLLERLR